MPQVKKSWNAGLQTLGGLSDLVESVAFSPNSPLLASASGNKTIRLWDTAICALPQKIKCYWDWVPSVLFSPDGGLLACGSDDKIVCLWDTTTGTLQQTLEGHLDRVHSVAFWSNGKTPTGIIKKVHPHPVLSVSSSPDDRLQASGSDDQTI